MEKRSHKKRNSPKDVMSVKVGPLVFETVAKCAEHYGVTTSTVYAALHRGTIDNLGSGRGNRTSHLKCGCNRKPVNFGRLSFASLSEASRALGYSSNYVSFVLRKGLPEARASLARRVAEYHAKQEMARYKMERARERKILEENEND